MTNSADFTLYGTPQQQPHILCACCWKWVLDRVVDVSGALDFVETSVIMYEARGIVCCSHYDYTSPQRWMAVEVGMLAVHRMLVASEHPQMCFSRTLPFLSRDFGGITVMIVKEGCSDFSA
jgi:hypothetical protein